MTYARKVEKQINFSGVRRFITLLRARDIIIDFIEERFEKYFSQKNNIFLFKAFFVTFLSLIKWYSKSEIKYNGRFRPKK